MQTPRVEFQDRDEIASLAAENMTQVVYALCLGVLGPAVLPYESVPYAARYADDGDTRTLTGDGIRTRAPLGLYTFFRCSNVHGNVIFSE